MATASFLMRRANWKSSICCQVLAGRETVFLIMASASSLIIPLYQITHQKCNGAFSPLRHPLRGAMVHFINAPNG
ncbi:hypothetical protein amb1690 [Paramagnetospirillum magneticum AMB-1]|uniref:Uncharacterized protein n=1 Tax=Paramagnetospirillum magneticum (strain ATCC 700264 / AMB-1) TaxID=342108 RepID=Q2W6N1_PARM1|nr:hypothetical protein amb1690 [Paramagnetospirillum magneticum AMB-1]